MPVVRPAWRLVAAALALTMATAAQAQRAEAVDHTALRVCADPGATPLSQEDGKGLENRIADLFAKSLGVPVRYVWFPSGIGFYRRTLNVRRCDLVMGTVAGNDIAQTTIPYYRSTYVLVTREGDGIAATRLDDPALRNRSLGVQAGTPVSQLMARAGLLDTMRSYDLMVDNRLDSGRAADGRGRRGAADGRCSGLGPDGWLFRRAHPRPAHHAAVGRQGLATRLRYRNGGPRREPRWRSQIDQLIRDNRVAIEQILRAANVPLLPMTEVAR